MSLVFVFSSSFLLTIFFLPIVIKVALKKSLFDSPAKSRKVHNRMVPNIGGVAIFFALLISVCLFVDFKLLSHAKLLLASGLVLFLVGLKDDISELNPLKKFIAQFIAAFIIVCLADIRFKNLHGIFGLYELSYVCSVVLSLITIVGMVNAFNLIDGIDGLCGSIGLIASVLFTILFYRAGAMPWAHLSLALSGALIGFLIYNVAPAQIFMGDVGSLLVGFVLVVFGMQFSNIASNTQLTFLGNAISIQSAPNIMLAAMIVPLFDTLRASMLRMLNNTSPFHADKIHLHHRLLSLGFNHTKSTLILCGVNILFVCTALILQDINATQLMGLLICMTLFLNMVFHLYVNHVSNTSATHKKNAYLYNKVATAAQVPVQERPSPSNLTQEGDFTEHILEQMAKN